MSGNVKLIINLVALVGVGVAGGASIIFGLSTHSPIQVLMPISVLVAGWIFLQRNPEFFNAYKKAIKSEDYEQSAALRKFVTTEKADRFRRDMLMLITFFAIMAIGVVGQLFATFFGFFGLK